jgi:hypothetical protein
MDCSRREQFPRSISVTGGICWLLECGRGGTWARACQQRAGPGAGRSAARLIAAYTTEIAELEQALSAHFERHPDAKIVRSLPGLGTILGARVLGEFGDDRTRFASLQSRKNYTGTSPITKASGRSHIVLARHARNRRLADALDQRAFCSLTTSPGARAYHDQLRGRGKTHRQALRQLASRWAGILHICLQRGHLYDETAGWHHPQPATAA